MKSKIKINREGTKTRGVYNALHAIKFFFVSLCLGGMIFFVSTSFSMPLNPDAYKKLKGTAKLGVIENMLKTAPPTLNKPSAQKFSTITGTRKILVILVDFSDNVGTTPSTNYDQMLFSTGTYTTGSMRDYYREVSYGKFDINGTVTVKWYRAPQTYAYYVDQLAGIYGAYPNNAQKLVEDIVKLADADIDFSQYDSNGDGYVDGLFIVHAGGGAEADGNYGKIWAHKWTTSVPVTVDGVKVFDYTMEPEDGNIGVFCHEYGHELGLWDFYDTSGAGYGIGDYSVMGTGAWNNGAKTPAQFDAWSKIQLGWVTPTVPTTNQLSAPIPQVETNAAVYKLWMNGDSTSKEYFLAENRQQTKFDASLPGSGLLIYHVDDNVVGDNTPSPHYHVAVMQADGLKNLENKVNKSDAGDYFPGSTANKNFSGSTTPNSKSYAGSETYVAVNNVSGSGATMTADIYVSPGDTSAPACAISSFPAYTNAASFTVAWSGTDTGNPASGVKTMDVQVRVGAGGAWTDWFTGTTATQAVYTGSEGQTIYFQCRAIDNAGNQGSYSSAASTTLDLTAPAASITPLAATQVTAAFTVSWSGSDNLPGVKSYDVEYMDAADGVWKNNWVQAGTTLTTASFAGIDGHTYYFRVRATDNAGNTGNFTSAVNGDAQTIVAVDSTPPVISNVQTANITSNSAAITWTTDEDADSQVEYGTTQNFGSATTLDSALTKNHSVSLSSLSAGTTYYFRVKSKDLAGNSASSSIQNFRTLYSFTVTVPKGLSMISFPLTPTDKNAGNIFGDANLKFARYDASVTPPKYHYYKDSPNDSYLEVSPARGFWVKLDAEKTITVTGDDETASTYSVSLNAGWNQIGNPYTSSMAISNLKVTYNNETVSFADANIKGWLANYFWSYENETTGYKLLTPQGLLTVVVPLDPGKGYWLYAAVPCSLVFTNPSTTTAKTMAKQNAAPQNSLVQFTLSSPSGSDAENYAGFAYEDMKISDPPAALEENVKPELYVKPASGSETKYAVLAKKKSYGVETFYLSAAGNDGEQGTLSWNFNAAEFSEATLVDESGKEISLLNEKQITLALTKEPKPFLVKLKLKAPAADATVLSEKPKILSAMNFPNPDRIGNATFRYSVKGDVTRVLIEVYNLAGRKITALEGDLSGETKWLFGDALASGVYIYRITAFSAGGGKDSVVRKMVVLK